MTRVGVEPTDSQRFELCRFADLRTVPRLFFSLTRIETIGFVMTRCSSGHAQLIALCLSGKCSSRSRGFSMIFICSSVLGDRSHKAQGSVASPPDRRVVGPPKYNARNADHRVNPCPPCYAMRACHPSIELPYAPHSG